MFLISRKGELLSEDVEADDGYTEAASESEDVPGGGGGIVGVLKML